jgi:taurine dioxygenase
VPIINDRMDETAIEVVPLAPLIGAEVSGVDVRALDERHLLAVRDAVLRYSAVVVRGQALEPEEQLAFMHRLYPLREAGRLNVFALDGYPQITVVSNIVEDGRPVGLSDAGLLWHTDTCFQPHPELFVSLYALELPEQDGRILGDTVFVSTAAAYDALPDSMKDRLDGLEVVQSYAFHLEKMRRLGLLTRPPVTSDQHEEIQDVCHPLVRVHPVTGRRIMYVNESFSARVVGLSPAESDAVLDELLEHLQRPEFSFTQRWRPGDLVVWDNAATQHRATFDYGDIRRRLHRASTTGPVPTGAFGTAAG